MEGLGCNSKNDVKVGSYWQYSCGRIQSSTKKLNAQQHEGIIIIKTLNETLVAN